jgi:ketosteroid isomerase-like protein
MSEGSVEVLRRVLDEWRLGEFGDTEIRSTYHADVEFLPRRAATEGSYRGIAGMERFLADTEQVFDRFEFHHVDLRDLGERVLAWGEIHVRAKGSGIETDVPFGGIVEFRNGKIVRWEDFGSKDQAMEAAGLPD